MQRFRQVLIEKHNELVRAYNSAKGDTRRVSSDGTEDYIDYAVSSYDRDFSLSLSEMERTQIRMIEDALRRIDRGEYGDCLQCGEPIPEKRLEVEPWARHCVRCQALEEQGLLQQRSYDSDYDDSEDVGDDDFTEIEADESDDEDAAEEEEDDSEEQEDEEGNFEAVEGGEESTDESPLAQDDEELEEDEREA